jgi:hypothetical protein
MPKPKTERWWVSQPVFPADWSISKCLVEGLRSGDIRIEWNDVLSKRAQKNRMKKEARRAKRYVKRKMRDLTRYGTIKSV